MFCVPTQAYTGVKEILIGKGNVRGAERLRRKSISRKR